MSDIQNIGIIVSKIVAESKEMAAQFSDIRKELSYETSLVDSLLRNSNQPEGKTFSLNLNKAQLRLAQAAQFLSAGEQKAEEWISKHIVAAASGKSRNDFPSVSSISDQSDSDIQSSELPLRQLSDYMSSHNYGQADYSTYSQDPVWRVLHRAAFPNVKMPPLNRQIAITLLNQYMSAHNYGRSDYETYSQDPVWQELNHYAFLEAQTPFPRPSSEMSSSRYNSIVSALNDSNVEHRSLELFGRYRTPDEIIERLGGGDRTEGSCSSLAFAYVGNRAGYDVLDFRDGQSRRFFSSNNSIDMIANLPGVSATIINGFDDIACTNTLLSSVQEGKEYYLATGQHAAIVRKIEDHYEFLELQSTWNNGWKRLDDNILRNRFGCETIQKYQYPNFLIDTDSLLSNREFLDILGYLNTVEAEQRKGEGGHVR